MPKRKFAIIWVVVFFLYVLAAATLAMALYQYGVKLVDLVKNWNEYARSSKDFVSTVIMFNIDSLVKAFTNPVLFWGAAEFLKAVREIEFHTRAASPVKEPEPMIPSFPAPSYPPVEPFPAPAEKADEQPAEDQEEEKGS